MPGLAKVRKPSASPFPSIHCPEPGAMDTASDEDAFSRLYCKTELESRRAGKLSTHIQHIPVSTG